MQHQHQTFDHDDEHEPEDTVQAVAEVRSLYQRDSTRTLDFMEALCDHAHVPRYREEFVQNRELLVEYANMHFLVAHPQAMRPYFEKAPRLVRLLLHVRGFATCYDHRKDYTDLALTLIQLVRPLLVGSWSRGPTWSQLTVQRSLILTRYPSRGADALVDLDAGIRKIRDIQSPVLRGRYYFAASYVLWKHHMRLRSIGYFLRSFAASMGAK